MKQKLNKQELEWLRKTRGMYFNLYEKKTTINEMTEIIHKETWMPRVLCEVRAQGIVEKVWSNVYFKDL